MSRTLGVATVSYTWDVAGGLPVILQDSAGNSYVYGLDLISRTDSAGAQEYYLTDGLGSTTGIADGSKTVVATYQYDAFGAIRAQTGSSPNEFTFTGEQVDGSGLQFLRARYYDTTTGRFLGRDPVPYLQRYAYAFNNPVNLTDPSGKEAAALTTTTMVLAPELVTPAAIAALIALGIYCVHEAVDDGNLWPCFPLMALLDALLEAREMELRRELAGPNVVHSEASEGAEGGAAAGASEEGSEAAREATEKVEKANSPIWQKLKPFRGTIKTNGESGKKLRYYEWDKTEHEIEVYDRNRKHLGSIDPVTGAQKGPPDPGRILRSFK